MKCATVCQESNVTTCLCEDNSTEMLNCQNRYVTFHKKNDVNNEISSITILQNKWKVIQIYFKVSWMNILALISSILQYRNRLTLRTWSET